MKKMGSDGSGPGDLQEFSLTSYETAMEALSSLITRRRRGIGSDRGEKFHLMSKYMKILDLEEHTSRLKIVHIAGTKGKGSTCAFSEAILRECGFRTGLFTSPHLIDVRERYRIDGFDISEDKFLSYFWDCWNQIKAKVAEDLPMPALFQFLTLLAFKIFIFEKVDVAIIEVGLGGTLDSTNVVKEPVVCGITSLGMDHMEILGDTLGKIALEKAGIFKPGVPAFTAPQLPEAMDALKERSYESKGNEELYLPEAFLRGLSTARLLGRAQIVSDTALRSNRLSEVNENSYGDLVFYFDGAHSPESMEVCARWFSDAVNVGRNSPKGGKTGEYQKCSLQDDGKTSDGSKKISKQILLFNCMEVRDPQLLLPQLFKTCASSGVHFSKALFVPSLSTYHKVDSASSTTASDTSKDLSWQSTLQRTWEKIIHGKGAIPEESSKLDAPDILPSYEFLYEDPSQKCNPICKQFACSAVIPSLPTTIKWLRDCVKENPSFRVQVLVTGSLHLIGDVLKLLRR